MTYTQGGWESLYRIWYNICHMGNTYNNTNMQQKRIAPRTEERAHKYGPSVIHLIAMGGVLLIIVATIFTLQA